MSPLRIAGVSEVTFGGLNQVHLGGLNHDFVVIHGPNESGKSTLAEFLAWLIAGPDGNAASAQRFGATGSNVGGRVNGFIGDKQLEMTGDFRILGNGAPSDTPNRGQQHPRRGTLDNVAIDGSVLRTMLGELTPKQFSLLFRLRAETMHLIDSEDDLIELFARYATGAIESRVEPRAVMVALGQKVAGLRSEISGFSAPLTLVKQQIKDASAAPADLRRLDETISRTQEDIESLGRTLLDISEQRGVIDATIMSFERKTALSAAEAELHGTEVVPAHWSRIADILDQVESKAAEVQSTEKELSETRPTANTASSAIGVSVPDLSRHVLGDAEKSAFRDGAQAVRNADNARKTAQDGLETAEQTLRLAEEKVGLALVQASITEAEVVHLTGNTDALRGLGNIAQAADTAHGSVAATSRLREEARIRREEAERNVAAAGGAGTPPAGRTFPPAFIVLAVTVVAVVAAAFVNAPVAAGAGIVGVITALVVARTGGRGAKNASSSDGELNGALLARQSDESRAISAHDEAKVDAAAALVTVNDSLVALGLPPAPAGGALLHVGNLDRVVTDLTHRHESRTRCDAARDEVTRAESSLSIATTTFERFCAQQGLSGPAPVDSIENWLDVYGQAIATAAGFARLEDSLATARAQLAGFTGGVPELDDAPNIETVLTRIRDMKKVKEAHDTATNKFAQCQRDLDLVIGGQHGVREMLDRFATVEAAREEKRLVDDRYRAIDDERGRAQAALGALGTERGAMSTEEILPELLEQQATLEESLEEKLHRHAVASAALMAIRAVVDKFELENQGPVIDSAQQIIDSVDPRFGALMIDRSSGDAVLRVVRDGQRIDVSKLSTGARTVIYLALRLAFIDVDSRSRTVALPLLCDDPVVSLDDERLIPALALLSKASASRQVILFTCHRRTVEVAEGFGAHVVNL